MLAVQAVLSRLIPMKKILVIPDVQAKPGHDFAFLTRIGRYIMDKRPDVIVAIGDFADMPSLSSYDKGKKGYEGRRYRLDIEASHAAMKALLKPMRDFNLREARKGKKAKCYRPRMVMTLGNHENRINRTIENEPLLDGTISVDDLGYEGYGWEVYPFLEVVVIEGVAFSHYFTTGVMGRPATSAQATLNKKHMSTVCGHQQGKQTASAYRADGKQITSIIAGSCYEHTEFYLGPQGNTHWRGLLVLHEVEDGEFSEMFVTLAFLKARYG